jgi:hypothetical protein
MKAIRSRDASHKGLSFSNEPNDRNINPGAWVGRMTGAAEEAVK